MRDEKLCSAFCPLTRAMGKIGNKWKPIIISVIGEKTIRFGQLDAKIPLITRKVLTEQLKELEEDGIISRQEFKELPPRVEYKLNQQGLELLPILESVKNWNVKFEELDCKTK